MEQGDRSIRRTAPVRSAFILGVILLLVGAASPATAEGPFTTTVDGYEINLGDDTVPVGDFLNLWVSAASGEASTLPTVEIESPTGRTHELRLQQDDDVKTFYTTDFVVDAVGVWSIYLNGEEQWEVTVEELLDEERFDGTYTRGRLFTVLGLVVVLIVGLFWIERRRRLRVPEGEPAPGVANPKAQDTWWG